MSSDAPQTAGNQYIYPLRCTREAAPTGDDYHNTYVRPPPLNIFLRLALVHQSHINTLQPCGINVWRRQYHLAIFVRLDPNGLSTIPRGVSILRDSGRPRLGSSGFRVTAPCGASSAIVAGVRSCFPPLHPPSGSSVRPETAPGRPVRASPARISVSSGWQLLSGHCSESPSRSSVRPL